MKASYVTRTGPPEVLTYGDLPDPKAGPTEVLIRVRAAALQRYDVFQRAGSHGTTIDPPQVLGKDMAGEVVEVGSEVQRLARGDRVQATGMACTAEYAVASAVHTLPIPTELGFNEAAALVSSGRAAYNVLIEKGRLRPGEAVLVIAAGSGTGHFAVQIAKAAGAYVIATVGSDDKRQRAVELGADETINHYTEDISERVRDFTDGEGVDLIAEQVGTPVWEACMKSLKPRGRFVTYGVTAGHHVDLHLGRVFWDGIEILGLGHPSDEIVRRHMLEVLRLVKLGKVRAVVHAAFPLAQAAEAHKVLEGPGFFGKVVLNP